MTVASEVVAACNSDAEKFHADLNAWASSQKKSLHHAAASQAQHHTEATQSIQALRSQEAEFKVKAVEVSKIQDRQVAELDQAYATIDKLKETERVAVEKSESIKLQTVHYQQQLKETELEREETLSLNEQRKLEFRNGIDVFSKRLGLSFERVEDSHLRFVFKHIDHEQPQREFYFSLEVSDSGEYILKECVPRVKGTDELIKIINVTNNISHFSRDMRKAFKASVTS